MPRLRVLDRTIFDHWNRQKLIKARGLIQGALELLEAEGKAPDAATALIQVLDRIDSELAK